MRKRSVRIRRLTVAVPSLAFVVGAVASASLAFAATLPVSSARVTTSSSSVSVAETTCSLTASADATLDRASQNTNFGTATTLSVRSLTGTNMRRSILRFDVASCSIPPAAAVRSATLRLTRASGPGSSRTYGIHRVNAAWAEGTVTYGNQPAFSATATSTVATGTAPASLSWSVLADVTAYVQGTATNNGWLVKDSIENAGTAIETIFASRQAAATANRPVLVIGYYP